VCVQEPCVYLLSPPSAVIRNNSDPEIPHWTTKVYSINCSDSSVLPALSWQSLPSSPVLAALSWKSCSDCFILAVPFLLSFSGCPLLSVLLCLSYPISPVLAYSGSHVLAVRSWKFCHGSLTLHVLFASPFLAVLLWLSSPFCSLLAFISISDNVCVYIRHWWLGMMRCEALHDLYIFKGFR
jgi:hypothetical protein